MEFFETYMNELVIGGSSTIGGLVIGLLKKFGNQLRGIEERLGKLEKDIAINTALDRERAKQK